MARKARNPLRKLQKMWRGRKAQPVLLAEKRPPPPPLLDAHSSDSLRVDDDAIRVHAVPAGLAAPPLLTAHVHPVYFDGRGVVTGGGGGGAEAAGRREEEGGARGGAGRESSASSASAVWSGEASEGKAEATLAATPSAPPPLPSPPLPSPPLHSPSPSPPLPSSPLHSPSPSPPHPSPPLPSSPLRAPSPSLPLASPRLPSSPLRSPPPAEGDGGAAALGGGGEAGATATLSPRASTSSQKSSVSLWSVEDEREAEGEEGEGNSSGPREAAAGSAASATSLLPPPRLSPPPPPPSTKAPHRTANAYPLAFPSLPPPPPRPTLPLASSSSPPIPSAPSSPSPRLPSRSPLPPTPSPSHPTPLPSCPPPSSAPSLRVFPSPPLSSPPPRPLPSPPLSSPAPPPLPPTPSPHPPPPADVLRAAMELDARGLAANRAGDAREALRCFARAHALAPRHSKFLLSAANMHLKLGAASAAAALYAELTHRALTPRQLLMVLEKLAPLCGWPAAWRPGDGCPPRRRDAAASAPAPPPASVGCAHLAVSLTRYKLVAGFAYFVIEATYYPFPQGDPVRRVCQRRFSEFVALHARLKAPLQLPRAALPPKAFFNTAAVHQSRVGPLERYLNRACNLATAQWSAAATEALVEFLEYGDL